MQDNRLCSLTFQTQVNGIEFVTASRSFNLPFRPEGMPVGDLALIGAAQRVEHYEISGYTTAKNLAQQARHSAVVALLSKSLAEEENADQLLNQIARSLMSVATMPAAIEQSAEAEELTAAIIDDTRPGG